MADAIRTVVATGRVDGLARADLGAERSLVERLYAPDDAPLWLTADARPTARVTEAIAALRGADGRGLDAADYDTTWLGDEAIRLAAARTTTDAASARFDVALSTALVRLLSDLHLGRVDPATLEVDYDRRAKRDELAALVGELRYGTPLGSLADAAEPPFLETRLLERQLARYRALAADRDLEAVVVDTKTRPGQRVPDTGPLARWLRGLGDLPADAGVSDDRYDGALVDAVQRFQLRHGLAPDGVIGPATAGALAVPAAARARQIALALERLRWLPVLARDRTVIVNVPGFEALAFDALGAGRPPALRMSVVVGQAFRNETPFFARPMTRVVFAPYWNVPRNILRKELLPKIRAHPGYLASEQLEIVSDGHPLAPTPDAIARLARGTAELRQRPGPKNALGHVKFLFPNPYDVYMHDTPARELFGRTRRDFSHGCIRLADAPAMAHWVLGGDDARIDELLASEQQTIVPLRHPIAVVIAYATAVANLDGTMAFYDDVYGHDAELEQALAERVYRP